MSREEKAPTCNFCGKEYDFECDGRWNSSCDCYDNSGWTYGQIRYLQGQNKALDEQLEKANGKLVNLGEKPCMIPLDGYPKKEG